MKTIIASAVGVLSFIGITSSDQVASPVVSDSVELGIVELSPRGPDGGYAMPASGDSEPSTCEISNVTPLSDSITFDVVHTSSTGGGGYPFANICRTSTWCGAVGINNLTLIATNDLSPTTTVETYEYSMLGQVPANDYFLTSNVERTYVVGTGEGATDVTESAYCESDIFEWPPATPPPPIVPPPPSTVLPTVTLTASPTAMSIGDASILQWTVADAATCEASGDWSGPRNTAAGSVSTGPRPTAETLNYTLTCTNSLGSSFDTATVVVSDPGAPPQCSDGIDNDGDGLIDVGGDPDCTGPDDDLELGVPTVTLTANPTSMFVGDASILQWTVEDADTCIASGRWSNVRNNVAGSDTTGPWPIAETLNYTLTCTNAAGSGSDTATVDVIPNTGATQCNDGIDNDGDGLVDVGSDPDCTGTGDDLELGVPTVTLTANPASIIVNSESSLLEWTVEDAATCEASGDWSGPRNTAAGSDSTGLWPTAETLNYTLTCTNAAGSGSDTATVDVIAPTGATCSQFGIDVSPRIIRAGESTTITWHNYSDAGVCTLLQNGQALSTPITTGPASCSAEHETTVTLNNSAFFTLSCPDNPGSDPEVRVQVTPVIIEN